ncbi:uncharacterized protein LOC111323557 [Stylophora pistillata]|uniref:uncharacterized protein LOC111323557 n=1 Tax=Stylophora pistillata TaxID=50429 RepID=UPI000C0536AA|nr:uncharacterized protein LOC111323557 [Stylophora pistillata]
MTLYECPRKILTTLKACVQALGMESGDIVDAQITASSEWDGNHAARQGRLKFQAVPGKAGSWSARRNDVSQWIQIKLSGYTKITQFATQGRNAYNQWVTKYKLQYSEDGVTFRYYHEPGQSSPKEFDGNKDSDTIVVHELIPPVQAQYIRLTPSDWHNHISMRMEVYGCAACSAPLGMETGLIKDAQITASSEWDPNHAALQGRLNFLAVPGKAGSWSAKYNNQGQWIQVDLLAYTKVTRTATQGRNAFAQWVTKYGLQYREDGLHFIHYREPGQSSPKEFIGNQDSDTIVSHQLAPAINARYIRLNPITWHNHVSMRIELYGCPACAEAVGMESGLIRDAQITASTEWDANHAAIQGRLNFLAIPGKAGSWSARHNNLNQWIQVDLLAYSRVTQIVTQGRNKFAQWVTKYTLQYSEDGVTFEYYHLPGQLSAKEFVANQDSDTTVAHQLTPSIKARYMRLHPTGWHNHISMRMELYGCETCGDPVGMESGLIKDAQITASTEWDANHAAIQGRLNFLAVPGKAGSWSARHNNLNQWIQVDLLAYTKVTQIVTQGRNAFAQWVTKYTLQYSEDGVTFEYYQLPGHSSAKEFTANSDSDTKVYHKLAPSIKARYVRLRPTAWHNHISMRMELYGCPACSDPLGMESGLIKDAQIKASTEWDANHAAIQGRLNFLAVPGKAGSWSARHNDVNQWIQVDLLAYTKVTQIVTQGRNAFAQWVTTYLLQYSGDGVTFHPYHLPGESSAKIFSANQDSDSKVLHELTPPINTRYVRLSPVTWHNHISLRMELYGCPACADALGMESRLIKDAQIIASSEWDPNHAAIQGRLNFLAVPGKAGSWSAKYNNVNQWIQVDLAGYKKVTGVVTQGRNAFHQWVTKYRLQFSVDGVTFRFYNAPGQNVPEEFDANQDKDTPVYHELNPPVLTRYVRLLPTAWHNHISMRMELYGCKACSAPLGMDNQMKLIKDAQISASSEWDGNHAAKQGRLNFLAVPGKAGSWSAKYNNVNQWIQIDLLAKTTITQMATQGRNAYVQWVKKYKVQYSDDGVNFSFYQIPGQSSPKEFIANQDSNTVVFHELYPSIEARYVRVLPTEWHNHISMRMELYGCED